MAMSSGWDALPEECKAMILSRLSTKEVARVARVSQEFLRAVNALRSSVQLLVLPPSMSVAAMEGMVAAHPNVKNLSFKRCGGKLKTFVRIIKAAASRCVDVVENERLDTAGREQKKRMRSLTAIDFRNCVNLIDTDVSILCSLHSRLEEVDLGSCPFVTDTALMALSRYQHVEKPMDPLEKYNGHARVFDKLSSNMSSDEFTASEEMFLRDNDAAVFEEIQNLGLSFTGSRSWPRIGGGARRDFAAYPLFTSRRYEEAKVLVASIDSTTSRRGDSSVAPIAQSAVGKKSYAQIAAKASEKSASSNSDLDSPNTSPFSPQPARTPEMISPSFSLDRADSKACSIPSSNKAADRDPSLPFIDWGLCDQNETLRSGSETPSAGGLLSDSDYRSSLSVADETWTKEMTDENRYRDMYKHYLIDQVENPTCVLPDLMDKLCLSTTGAKDLNQTRYGSNLARLAGQSESKFKAVERTRTQTEVLFPDMLSVFEDAGASKQKAVRVAGGTELRDQRLQIGASRKPGRTTPDGSSEAFCRTLNRVGVFAVPGAGSKFDTADMDELGDRASNSSRRRSASRASRTPSDFALCRPEAASGGGTLRTSVQAGMSPENHAERYMNYYEKRRENDGPPESEIDVSGRAQGLRKVSVASCPEVTDRGVQALLKGTSRSCLSTLDVSRCGGVTSAGLRIPAGSGLLHLVAVQMPAINRLVFQLPVQSLLQHLNLAGCSKLEELVLVTSSLKVLNLSNCKKLTRLHLKCPSLTALNLSVCDGLERLLKFHCGALQSLNVMACRALLQSSMNAAVESATGLEELRCGGCDRIERLDLVQSKLILLDVSGTQSLKRLYCQSKLLKVVDACGCKNLAEVYLFSPYLRRMLFSNCALLQVLVIPLDAIKETMDAAVAKSKSGGIKPDELEISISGCNMPEVVKKNLTKLMKQWQYCFQ